MIVAALTLAAIGITASVTTSAIASTPSSDKAVPHALHMARVRTVFARIRATHAAASIGVRFTTGKNETRIVSIGYLNWLYRDFQGHDRYYAYLHARRIPGLMCIHSHEGAWNAYNPAGYYGGLQMDWSFMRTYGWDMLRKYHWRDARYWSPTDQLAVASRAVAHRGYWPWYNSAAACGLI
jgi:hypothetical protein